MNPNQADFYQANARHLLTLPIDIEDMDSMFY